MKRENEEKLAELEAKRVDYESTLKTHNRELEVSYDSIFLDSNSHKQRANNHFVCIQIYINTRMKCQQQLEMAKRNQTNLFNEKSKYQTIIACFGIIAVSVGN